MNGISMTVAPSSRRLDDSAPAWWRARPTRMRRAESGSLDWSGDTGMNVPQGLKPAIIVEQQIVALKRCATQNRHCSADCRAAPSKKLICPLCRSGRTMTSPHGLCGSRLLGHGDSLPVDFFQNLFPTAAQESFANGFAKLDRMTAV